MTQVRLPEGVTQHRHGSLAERAYEHVRNEILRGRLAVGQPVPEGAVAEALAISKTPVRQALQALRKEGLLEVGPRRQMIVRGFTPEHRREVMDIRLAVESLSVTRACERMALQQIDYLRLLLLQQRRVVDAGDEDEFIDLDEQFHLYIAAAASLPLVERILSELRGFVRMMRLGISRPPEQLRAVLAEHEALLDAIEARDTRLARRLLRTHLLNADH